MSKLKLAFLGASTLLAMIFTVSCSGDDGKDGEPGKDAACIFEPITGEEVDSLAIICNDQRVGVLVNGKSDKDNCLVSEAGAYFVMKCGEEKIAEWPKASCGQTAYDPASEMTCNKGVLSYTFIDVRDSNKYKAVVIGTQTWMAENLRYKGKDTTKVLGLCYENYSGVSADSVIKSCVKYGRLYNWSTVMAFEESCNSALCEDQVKNNHQGICPEGWHIPASSEFTTLINLAGGANIAGKSLKTTSGWEQYYQWESISCGVIIDYTCYSVDTKKYFSGNGTDDYGFSALPGGGYYLYYGRGGPFFSYDISVGWKADFWLSSEANSSTASYRGYSNDRDEVSTNHMYKESMLSVRCIKDK